MKGFLECYSCIIRQTIEILNRTVKNRQKRHKILTAVIKRLIKVNIYQVTPPEATRIAHKIIHKMTGIKDLYQEPKRKNNLEALELYPYAKGLVKQAKDPLLMAIRLAIAGNIIDYGALGSFNIRSTIKEVLKKKFAVLDCNKFKQELARSKFLFYIGDNAGEIVFDKVLIEELVKYVRVVFAVKSKPVLNDVLKDDAKMVGLDRVVKVIASGSDHAGTTVKDGTKEFKMLFKKADMVIAKGQGNFETLDQEKKNIYFLLKMKCPCLAHASGLTEGDIILKRSRKIA